jgi:outer membrane receptor protein involved in Fe transport
MNAYFSTAFNPAVDFEDVFDQNLVSTQNRNVSSAEFKGYELDIAYDISGTHLALSYGETAATDKDSGERLDVPADRWVLDASQDFLQGDLAAGVRVTQADNLKSTTEGLDDVDGYTITDAYLAWEPTHAALNGLRIDLAIGNLGDKDYRRNSFSLPSAGRDIQLTARYRF